MEGAAAESFHQAKNLLEELEKTTFKVIQEREEIEKNTNSPQLKLENVKMELSETKWQFIDLQSKLFFLDFLQSENKGDWNAEKQCLDAELKEERKKLRGYKDNFLDVVEEMEDLSQAAEEKYISVKEKMEQLKSQLDEMEIKEKYIESIIKNRAEVVMSSLGIKESEIDEYLENQTRKLADTERKLLNLTAQNNKMEVDIKYLTEACENLDLVLVDKEKQKEKLELLNNTESEDINMRLKWCQDSLEFITNLGGVKEKEMKKDCLILEFLNPSSEEVPNLELTLCFGKGTFVECVLQRVEVNISEFDIDDIINYGVKENDLKFIVQQVKHRWLSYQPLYVEIFRLKKRFDLNWLYKERLLTMTAGINRETLCTLSIDFKYPDYIAVTLSHIKSSDKDVSLNNLKPAVEKPSLTTWVEYLHQILQ